MKRKERYVTYVIIGIACLSAALTGTADEAASGIRMLYTAQSGYQPDELQMLSRMFTELSGIDVEIEYVSYEKQYHRILHAASEYDVISLDQIWLMDLIAQQLIAPLDKYITRKMREDISIAIMRPFRSQKRTWAFPLFVNVQMFYYNRELLRGTLPDTAATMSPTSLNGTTPATGFGKPPKTLEEMVSQMFDLKEQGIVEYPWTDAWQQGEGLMDEYVWLTSAFGGTVFNDDGLPVFDQKPGVKALEFMMMLLQKQLASPAVLTNDEISAKNAFVEGKAVFTTNWLFQEGLLGDPATSPLAIGMIPASKTSDKKSASVSSLQGLAITAASHQKDVAWKWIKFLTSPLVQRAYLFEMPIWSSVQTSDDASMLVPNLAIKLRQLKNAQYRPKLVNYTKISDILQKHLAAALKTSLKEPVVARDVLIQAKQEIEAVQQRGTEPGR